MNVGEIYFWVTDKAVGHSSRPKFHVYIGEAGWREQGHAFLFISSSNFTGCDYQINKVDYAFLTKDVSFVSCGRIVAYADHELAAAAPKFFGALSHQHLAQLRTAIANSDVMENWQILLVCGAIDGA